MHRREFLRLVAVAPVVYSPLLCAADRRPEIAFTFDDPKLEPAAGLTWQEINQRMLRALDKRGIKATLFVCGKRVDQPEGKQLIAEWDKAGHAIANHSYSHLFFNASGGAGSDNTTVTLTQFEDDALKNEPL